MNIYKPPPPLHSESDYGHAENRICPAHYCWVHPITAGSTPLLLGPPHYCWVHPITAGSTPLLLGPPHYCWVHPITAGSTPLLLGPCVILCKKTIKLAVPLALWDITPSLVKRGGDVVVRHNTLRDVLAETCHRAHLGIQVEAGNDLKAVHSHTHPIDLLLTNWATGKTAAFDIPVTFPLNTHTLMEVGVSAGSAAPATEGRKDRASDAKFGERDWLCVPIVTETYDAWGT